VRPAPDLVLGGRYRLTRQIAVGGMGEVWAAHDESLDREIAIKVLREEFAGDQGFLERFRTEARNAGSLSHSGIAALFDYGEQDGSAFLVMELVLGEPMSDLLEREPVLPPRRLLPILSQTARALHAAHQSGVVHRDVKPGNILLTPSGKVKITDFGVSLSSNQVPMTATGMVMGTAQYLSPEQAVGGPATAASDLYALGIIAYEASVGHRPFTGPTAVDIAVAHVNTAVPPLPPSVPQPLTALIMRLLAKDPAHRPGSAEELAGLLDALEAQTPADGAPPPVTIVPGRAAHASRATAVDAPLHAWSGTGATGAGSHPDPAAPPPSFDPRTGRRTQPPSAPTHRTPGARAAHPPTRAHARVSPGRPRVRWPLLVLAVLVIALLGAALANRVTGAADLPVVPGIDGYTRAAAGDGMISEQMAALTAWDTRTTTAKDA
jgi:eukaryotic-like serine/threonine-protein kinase